MALAQIDIPAMRRLIGDVRGTATGAHEHHTDLAGLLLEADLSSAPALPMRTAAGWLDDQLPMLRRRLALAEVIQGSTPGAGMVVQIDEALLSELSPEEAEELGQELAEQIRNGPHTQELADQLAQHAADPYVASALLQALSPEELARYLGSVDFDAPRSGQADLDYARRHGGIIAALRIALQTAARSDELPDGYAEGLAEVIMTGDGDDAVALADFLTGTPDLHPDLAGPTADARAVIEGYHELVGEGLLGADPSVYLREWIGNVQGKGGDLVDLARQEGVEDDTFALLEELEVIRDPDGRAFFQFGHDHADDARQIAELTELLAGGQPSTTAWRRDANSWTFDTLLGQGDIELVLNDGGAIAATPEGIFMAVGDSDVIVTSTDVFAYEAGTMWGEIFMVNQEASDPSELLESIITGGTLHPDRDNPHPLWRVLKHEEVHAQQWARYGHLGFIARYLWHQPWDPCNHPFEEEAGFEDGGYFQCV